MTEYTFQPAMTQQQSNSLGVAGFVVSLVGVVLGGLLCPVGLIMSLIALGRQPKGFAIAGVVIGLLGSCGGVIVGSILVAALFAAGTVGVVMAKAAMMDPNLREVFIDMGQTAALVEKYRDDHGALPAELSNLDGMREATRRDPWGKQYQYHLTEEKPGYDLESAGEDGVFGTEDDFTLLTLGEKWNEHSGFNIEKIRAGDGDGGTVNITVGGLKFELAGDDEGGRILIHDGDQIIRIEGGDDGGYISTESTSPPPEVSPEAPPEAPPEVSPEAPPEVSPGVSEEAAPPESPDAPNDP